MDYARIILLGCLASTLAEAAEVNTPEVNIAPCRSDDPQCHDLHENIKTNGSDVIVTMKDDSKVVVTQQDGSQVVVSQTVTKGEGSHTVSTQVSVEPPPQDEEANERIIVCVFSQVPYIGGSWLAYLSRLVFDDDLLLRTSFSFIDAGTWFFSWVDFEGSTSTFFRSLSECFDDEIDREGEVEEREEGLEDREGDVEDGEGDVDDGEGDVDDGEGDVKNGVAEKMVKDDDKIKQMGDEKEEINDKEEEAQDDKEETTKTESDGEQPNTKTKRDDGEKDVPSKRVKRTYKDQGHKGGGYGMKDKYKDPLLSFIALGILVVGSMIAYLAYLLVAAA